MAGSPAGLPTVRSAERLTACRKDHAIVATHRSAPWRPALVSVVVPCRNGAATLEGQLGALVAQRYTGAWEVVIADNGSTDHSVEIAHAFAERLPALTIADASRSSGINVARNEGARAARGDLLLFCDSDDEAADNWLESMVRAAGHASVVGGPLDPRGISSPSAFRWRRGSTGPKQFGQPGDFLAHAHGANLGIRAWVLRDIGGWNESYAGGGDDIELCWRAQLAGHQLAFVPEAVMHYRLRGDRRSGYRQARLYGRSLPQLYRQFRPFGMPPVDLAETVGRWWGLVRDLPAAITDPVVRGQLGYRFFQRVGRLEGCVRYRVFYP